MAALFRSHVNLRGKYTQIITRNLRCGVRNFEKEAPPELYDYPGKAYTSEWQIQHKGKIYDHKPFKFKCEKGKAYYWCACGLSKGQPFCDGSHKGPLMQSILKPVLFIAPEDKEYWFCNCKRTNHRPLCDGSHKLPEVVAKIRP